jgi:hypothetical protein
MNKRQIELTKIERMYEEHQTQMLNRAFTAHGIWEDENMRTFVIETPLLFEKALDFKLDLTSEQRERLEEYEYTQTLRFHDDALSSWFTLGVTKLEVIVGPAKLYLEQYIRDVKREGVELLYGYEKTDKICPGCGERLQLNKVLGTYCPECWEEEFLCKLEAYLEVNPSPCLTPLLFESSD